MGIIKAGVGSLGGVLSDQWLEMFYCSAIPAEYIAVKGTKQQREDSANTKGEADIISDGSVVVVNEGQCAMIFQTKGKNDERKRVERNQKTDGAPRGQKAK